MSRLGHAQSLLGPELFKKVKETPVLVVGAGGIGCELLKNLVLVGFANIEIIDLDTIDLSNLNRQFLFRKPDIKKSKALVAAATARHFNPSSGINIHARHGNVKDGQNDLEWISKFGLVLNALDNMDARRHVNKLCQAANVPLIESGTAGYLGQVTPIIHDETECYDCVVKPTPKSFPVCTIRATPSEPIHCIVWAKSYLFGKLFGEDDEDVDTAELDQAQASGENAEEIDNLKKEAAAFREVRKSLGEEDGPRRVFSKVFTDDINRLLAMDDMWKVAGRVKPVALDYDSIMNGTFVTPPLRTAAPPQPNGTVNGDQVPAANGSSHVNGDQSANGSTNGEYSGSSGSANQAQLRDQKELSVKENLELFVDSCRRLSNRTIAQPDVILSFDKDDDDTLDFVLATANLRAIAYGIANKTRFQVKEMAGNIIPAIATTNAIIAGFIVMQAFNLLSRKSAPRQVALKSDPVKVLVPVNPPKPNPQCAVCRDVYIPFKVDTTQCTLGDFINYVVKDWLEVSLKQTHGEDEDDNEELYWSVYEGGRVLADADFDDNHERTLADLGVDRGRMITVRDEDEKYRPIQFSICELSESAEGPFELPSTPPAVPLQPPKPKARSETPDEIEAIDALPVTASRPSTSRKRGAPEGEDGEDEAPKKRRVVEHEANGVIEID